MPQPHSTHTHYELLDGMRGIAAICVMLHHFTQRYTTPLFSNGTLAVDFFFILSGFVIMHSYGQRLKDNMSIKEYLMRRWIRLYPMMIAGLIVGTLTTLSLIRSGLTHQEIKTLAISFTYNIFFLPFIGNTTFQNANDVMTLTGTPLFPSNTPSWSLFFEMIAGICFIALHKAKTGDLIKITTFSFLLFAFYAFIQRYCEGKIGFNFSLGWGSSNIVGGLCRVLYGFTLGILILKIINSTKRTNPVQFTIPKYFRSPVTMYALLVMILIFPKSISGLYPATVLLFLAPYCIYIGSKFTCRENSALQQINRFLGSLSYPLYCIHYPIGIAINAYAVKYSYTSGQALTASILITFVLSLLLLRYYDEPVRRFLNKKLLFDATTKQDDCERRGIQQSSKI